MKVLSPAITIPLFNMFLRGMNLVGRFGLTVYITKYIGLEAMGVFGLVVGGLSMLPAFIGFGLNYFVNREIVGEAPEVAINKVKDRLLFTFSMTVLVVICFSLISNFDILDVPKITLVIVFITIIECLGFDLHYSVISLGRPVIANVLLFIRTTIWTFPAIAMGIFYIEFRNLDFIWWCWALGLFIYGMSVISIIKSLDWQKHLTSSINLSWLISLTKKGPLIYLSDLGVVIVQMSDRFILALFLDIAIVGAYVFNFSIANAVYTLINSAFTQVAVPKFVGLVKKDKYIDWKIEVERQFAIQFLASTVISVFVFAMCYTVGMLGYIERSSTDNIVLIILLAGMIVKVQSDIVNYAFYSQNKDKLLIAINIGSIPLFLFIEITIVYFFGYIGVASALLIFSLAIYLLRLFFFKNHIKQLDL